MEDYGHSNYKLFLSGDPKGFENVVKHYRNNMILFVEQYVRDFAAAEDVTQEVFVKIYIKKPHFAARSSFKTWLYAIARREALDYLKKQRTHAALDEAIAADDSEYVDTIVENEEKRALYRALDSLNEDYRRVLYLKYFEDLSVKEISALLKKSPKQVTDMLYNAKKALSAVLKRESEIIN